MLDHFVLESESQGRGQLSRSFSPVTYHSYLSEFYNMHTFSGLLMFELSFLFGMGCNLKRTLSQWIVVVVVLTKTETLNIAVNIAR
jgi:hypothetical protein